MKQLYWRQWKGILTDHSGRYMITEVTQGFVVSDKETGEIRRVSSLAAAKAWAEIRFGGQIVHHVKGRLEYPRWGRVAGNERPRRERAALDRHGAPPHES